MQTKAEIVLRIGTRGSLLALAQAHEVRSRICAAHDIDETTIEIVVISTAGDRIQDKPLSEVGGKGLFSKEIEASLSRSDIDLAVHSSKDMATILPNGLELSAFLPREDVRDAFLSPRAKSIMDLPHGAVIGSASLRRQALIARMRPDIKTVLFRGNVQTRLKKLANGDVDATLLAFAGLKRLGNESEATSLLPVDEFLPAPGQGAICIETRIGDTTTLAMIAPLDDRDTRIALTCERAFLAALDGSCRTPIAGYALVNDGQIKFSGMILTPDGQTTHETTRSGDVADAEQLGREAGEQLKQEAGVGFFESWQ